VMVAGPVAEVWVAGATEAAGMVGAAEEVEARVEVAMVVAMRVTAKAAEVMEGAGQVVVEMAEEGPAGELVEEETAAVGKAAARANLEAEVVAGLEEC